MAQRMIRLDEDIERTLDEYCKDTGREPNDVVRDALRRQLSILRFERLRNQIMPYAEAQGYVTDEDVFDEVT